ncbi:MAG TPA: autotransporter outer membrane beta-barrel domain-containing protein [Pseudomonas sp.]|jgi:outer membrane autotransporter protein
MVVANTNPAVKEIINNDVVNLDSSSVAKDLYTLLNGSKLNADGATLYNVDSNASDVSLKNNTQALGNVRLERGGRLDIDHSTVRNTSFWGQQTYAVLVGENVVGLISSSSISGKGIAISAIKDAVLDIVDTKVQSLEHSYEKPGLGIGVFGSRVGVSAQSHIIGKMHAAYFNFGARFDVEYDTGWLKVDNSLLESLDGATLKVDNALGFPADYTANIYLKNNAELISGNGNLLEVEDGSTANFKVEDSRLNGNLVADDTSHLNVTLQNNAQLTGDIVNSNTLAITSGAAWQMVGDSNVKSLAMDGGRVSFGEGAFKTLTLGGLSGSGTFDMRINLDQHAGDLLKVNGLASGSHTLNVQNTGVELVTPEVEPLLVVNTEGGDAQFGLLGGKADLGVYSYELEQRGDDWYIVGSGKTISPSTRSVLALFNAAPNIWNSELTTLRSRMGEVRGKPLGGAWMRSYGSRFNASTGDGVDYQQKQSGFTLGVDAPLDVGIGELSLGLMAGYSKNDLDLSRGTSGNVDSYYVGGYGTWLLDDGYYLDGVLKLNRFRNESKVAMSDGTKAKGDYESTGVGGSLEFGRHINLADGYFLEPYAQLSGVSVQGDSYRLDNGMRADNDRTQSVLGKVGTSAGRSIALEDGSVLTPYLRLAVAQEFSRSNDVKVNDSRFGNDLSGSRGEVGAGVSVSLSERLQLHADLDYMKGKNVEQPWGANVGLKLAF